MSPEQLEFLFTDDSLRAVAPLIVLSAGALLVLIAAFVPALYSVRGVIMGFYHRVLQDLLFVVATLLAWLFSVHYYRDDRPFQAEHDVLMLVTPLGMSLMAGAQDLIVNILAPNNQRYLVQFNVSTAADEAEAHGADVLTIIKGFTVKVNSPAG